jgi:pimeloyl-ACP methyl ester carboxylesterase
MGKIIASEIYGKVISKDSTRIAFEKLGKGPALILVGGSFEQRAMDSETSQLAAQPLLAKHFTLFHYDRRGRGDSTDTQPYAVAREVEDIEALIDEAGGSAFISGISSGAILAMEAAIPLGDKVKKLALYEPPYNFRDEATGQLLKKFRQQFKEALAQGRRGDAVGHFLEMMGLPPEELDGMRQLPMWPMWEAIAPTFGYDAALMGEDGSVPSQRAARIAVPTLIMNGGASFSSMHLTAAALAAAIPNAQHRTLEGQTHEVAAEVLAPVLVEFFHSP